ncbi:hypothetical protein ACN2EN_09650 [Aliarcobacter lanthieri]|uniref:DUF4282 domain-containing protein n=1 Tax=Arcobacter lacus TaxID=1912876 RepID=A0ABX5JJ36_9BACT|nr:MULTISPECIES: hypothetical protein [Arcobacteraceae]MCT7648992.1 hypothetical protein [Aliarcobacter butzleri]PUE64254.1 hypothetical protein B0175_11030 [Arcobacter lacus]
MISKLRHELGGVNSIEALVYLCIYIFVMGTVFYCFTIHFLAPFGLILLLGCIYLLATIFKLIMDAVNKMNQMIFKYIASKVSDEKNKIR